LVGPASFKRDYRDIFTEDEADVAEGVHVNFSVSTGVVGTATDFLFLASWMQENGGMDKEVGRRPWCFLVIWIRCGPTKSSS
jgi:hypothetical protein